MALFMYAVSQAVHHRRWVFVLLMAPLSLLAVIQYLSDTTLAGWTHQLSAMALWLTVGYAVFRRCPHRVARTAPS
ncbi:MAG: hypothetical protein ACT4PO_03270 [Actinomycetota bacterium]